jgi:hypothetical protein
MLFKFLEAFTKSTYKVQGFKKDDNGDTIILYGYRNKRSSNEYRKLASDIVKDEKLRKNFDYDDYTEIVSLSQYDSFVKNNDINKDILKTFESSQRNKYVFLPYLIALTAVMWCFCAIIGHRFLMLNIDSIDVYLPGAIFIFPVIYFLADLIQEVYGYSRARQTLWVCIFCHVTLGVLISFILSFNTPSNVDIMHMF